MTKARPGLLAFFAALLLALVPAGLAGGSAHAQTTEVAINPAPMAPADLVVVYKSLREMSLMRGGQVIRTYRIALGGAPVGPKLASGDERTPEGVFTIDSRKLDSDFHLALHISYPQLTNQVRSAMHNLEPGGAIMIHGMPNDFTESMVGHPTVDWTNGCIAVTNREIEEIWQLVADGTQIVIFP
jgi:murein L,D-transpeptidase YafK